jgi:hypothetical protein
MYTKEQIAAGLELAKHWYEGWTLEKLEPEQLIEAVEKAVHMHSHLVASIELLRRSTAAQREEFFEKLAAEFCLRCGSVSAYNCQCENDD